MVGIKLFRIELMRFYKLYLILTVCTVLFLGNTTICNAELYDWTEWSAWQDSSVSENDDRQVETRKVVESYAVESWVYTDYSSNSKRGYWPHSTANALRAHYTETWPKEWIDNARWVIAANTYYDSPDNDNCDGMVHDQTAYVCVHGQGHDYVPFFIVGTNYKTQYRYREKVYLESDIEEASIDSKTDAGTLTISDNGRPLDENIRVILNNRVLTKDVDYTVSYDASIETGPVNVIITGSGDYTGSVTVKCTKVPKRTVVRTITAENNQIIVYWDESDDADGFEIEYSLNSDFSSSVSKDCKKGSTTASLSGIKQSGTYYVRVRTYRTRSKVRYYSAWSNTNTVYLVIQNNNFDLSKAYINPIPDKKYTGKAITPVPTIMNGTYELAKDVDYTVEYRNNKKVGTATVIMTGKGDYYGTAETTFKIIPKGTSIKKATKKTKAITIKWKKNADCSGYQIRYSTKENYSNAKTIIVNRNKTKYTIKGLKSVTKYYIQIRCYNLIKQSRCYSSWSKVKKIKTALSKRQKAMRAYYKLMEKGEDKYGYDGFAIFDFNKDGVPELIKYGGGQIDYTTIYSYKKGKIHKVHWCSGLYVYSNGIIRTTFSSGMGYWLDTYHRMTKKLKLKYVYRYAERLDEAYPGSYYQGKYAYDKSRSKKVSKKTVKKNIRKVLKGAKIKKLKYHDNTSYNRERYLK